MMQWQNHERRMVRRIFIIAFLMEACYFSLYAAPRGPAEVLFFLGVNVATYLLFCAALWSIRPAARSAHDLQDTPRDDSHAVWMILACGLLFRLTLVPHHVVGSDDIYRYLWDGKVLAAGVNPYAYLPTDRHLSFLASADLPALVNHPGLRTIYPPLAQAFFWFSAILWGESAAGFKLLLVLADALTMVILAAFLRGQEGRAWKVMLYAWSPLPVLYFGLDGHIDAIGIPFLILALLFLCTGRKMRGALALGFGMLAKLAPVIVVPFLLRGNGGGRTAGHPSGSAPAGGSHWFFRALLAGLPLAILGGGYLLFLEPTWGIADSLMTFGSRWEFNGGIFYLLHGMIGVNETTHLVCGIAIMGWIAFLTLRDLPLVEKVFWGFTGFLLLSPVVHPWYLTWLAALLALRWSPAVCAFLGLSCVANLVVYQYRAFGLWTDQPLLLLIEYVPVGILLVREILRHEVLTAAGADRRPAARR